MPPNKEEVYFAASPPNTLAGGLASPPNKLAPVVEAGVASGFGASLGGACPDIEEEPARVVPLPSGG